MVCVSIATLAFITKTMNYILLSVLQDRAFRYLVARSIYADSFFARHWLNFSIYDLFLKRYESKYYNIQMSTLCASYK